MPGWLADPNRRAPNRAEARALRFAKNASLELLAAREFFGSAEYAKVSWIAFETPPAIAEADALAGASSATTSAVASLLTTIQANGASLAAATAAGALSSTVSLAVVAVAQSAISAALTTIISAIGSSTAAATVAGTLQAEIARVSWLRFEAPPPQPAAGAQLAGEAAATTTATGTVVPYLGSMTAAWSAVTGAVGYRMKAGTAPGVYTLSADVGNVLLGAIGGLVPGMTWYLNVVALDADGNEGLPAIEISGLPDVPGAPLDCTGAIISGAVATAMLGTEIRTAGTVQAMTAVAGALQGASAALAGRSDTTATVQGALGAAAAALQGFAAATTSAAAQLQSAGVALAAFAAAQSDATAQIGTITALAGASAAQSDAEASLEQTNVIVLASRRSRPVARHPLRPRVLQTARRAR